MIKKSLRPSPERPRDRRRAQRRPEAAAHAFSVVLADGPEDVENKGSFRPAIRRVLDATREHVSLQRSKFVRDPVDHERLHSFEYEAELLVIVAV
jgi:hypothetical protein